MKVIETKLQGVQIIETKLYSDHRGYLMESYNRQTYFQNNIDYSFVQDTQSLSAQAGVIRGLHYQLQPKSQAKLVRVVAGAIYDVVVDIRQNSPTFGQWLGIHLSAANNLQILIPKGFAHGFCTTEPNTVVFYKVDEYYSPENERGILWCDPDLAINWPTTSPILSQKDEVHPLMRDAEINFCMEE